MQSIELEESIEMRCTLYERFAYETDYLSMPGIASLSDEERRKGREQDKEDFLDWLWLSPLARGLAGDGGLDELDRLRKFAEANRLDCGRTRHDYRKLEEAIKDAVEDDLIIPVIDRTDDWGCDYLPAADSETRSLEDGLLRASGDFFAPLSNVFGGGEPILSGPYDPAMQEAKVKAARVAAGSGASGSGSFDWLGAAEVVAGVARGAAGSGVDGDPMHNFGNSDENSSGGLLGDAQPFEWQPDAFEGDGDTLAGMPIKGGPPNAWVVNPSGSGQLRVYDASGNAAVDIDFDHDHGFGAPHSHNWDGKNRDLGNPVSILPY